MLKKLINYTFTFLIVLICAFNSKKIAFAQGDLFDTEYSVIYEVETDGQAQVNQNIKIINKKSDVIATNYSLNIKQMNIFDANGADKEGTLEVETEKIDGTTKLKMEFNEQAIGEGRQTELDLSYKTKDISSKVGQIWNVTIPRVELLKSTLKYDVTLVVPKSFGPKIFMSPTPIQIDEKPNTISYKFDKESLLETGVTASFGKYQVFNYKLGYGLQNETSFADTQEIALPPDITGMQQVYYKSLKPEPKYVRIDKDGNYIAGYKIKPKEKLNIELIGSVRISGKQINTDFGGSFKDLPANIVNDYTNEDKYWESNSLEIQDLAKKLFDPSLNVSENAKKIYDYITLTLSYDFEITRKDFVERNGALKALTHTDSAACMEFTDLFIATARAMGIPARELDGHAAASDGVLAPLSISLRGGDLLHAWPEYYDPNFGWVPIDPTWGSTSQVDYFTKLDTNHFVFAIKGIDSEFPLPAGTYKIEGSEKQVEIDYAQDEESIFFVENATLYKTLTLNPLKKFKKEQDYLIKNDGTITLFNINGTAKNLPPGAIMKITLPKESTNVSFINFNNENKNLDLEITKGKPSSYNSTNSFLIIVSFLGLGLYTIFYLFLIRQAGQKR